MLGFIFIPAGTTLVLAGAHIGWAGTHMAVNQEVVSLGPGVYEAMRRALIDAGDPPTPGHPNIYSDAALEESALALLNLNLVYSEFVVEVDGYNHQITGTRRVTAGIIDGGNTILHQALEEIADGSLQQGMRGVYHAILDNYGLPIASLSVLSVMTNITIEEV